MLETGFFFQPSFNFQRQGAKRQKSFMYKSVSPNLLELKLLKLDCVII